MLDTTLDQRNDFIAKWLYFCLVCVIMLDSTLTEEMFKSTKSSGIKHKFKRHISAQSQLIQITENQLIFANELFL